MSPVKDFRPLHGGMSSQQKVLSQRMKMILFLFKKDYSDCGAKKKNWRKITSVVGRQVLAFSVGQVRDEVLT